MTPKHPTKPKDISTNVWIDFSSRTVELRSSECLENLPFCFSLPFIYLSLSDFFSFLFASPPFLFFFLSFSPFLIHRTSFLLFAPISFSHFLISPFSFISPFSLISLIFSLLSFSSLFIFLPFLFSISHLDCINRSKSRGNFLPLSSIATCHHHHFSLNFLIFLFPLFPSFDTWLNVSHSHKCTTWLMSCVTPLRCHVAFT